MPRAAPSALKVFQRRLGREASQTQRAVNRGRVEVITAGVKAAARGPRALGRAQLDV
jgi:hypothetical protein